MKPSRNDLFGLTINSIVYSFSVLIDSGEVIQNMGSPGVRSQLSSRSLDFRNAPRSQQ